MDLFLALLSSALFLGMALLVVGVVVSKAQTKLFTFSSPFECGFSPSQKLMHPVSSQFFIMMMIFLVFDVELIILYPFILSQSVGCFTGLLMITSVLNLLAFGFFFEWVNSMLEWIY